MYYYLFNYKLYYHSFYIAYTRNGAELKQIKIFFTCKTVQKFGANKKMERN